MKQKKYKITTFKNRFATEGNLIEKTFEEIYYSFKNKVKRTREKYVEYLNADKQTQTKIKDVGGFIGGETGGNKRISGVKIRRQILTLDIDSKYPNVFNYLERNVPFYCFVHTTHRHNPDENRFRIIAPLSREVNEDEYEALGRRIAYKIENSENETLQGLFDETTFQANRLMFYPSVSADGEYICELLNLDMMADEQKIIDVDEVLSEYLDRNDVYEWFKPEKIDKDHIGKATIQNKNPLKAPGLIGAFNRTYSITEAIDKFLSHVYTKEKNGRYTYVGGDSYGGGIVLNEDTLFYSHHGTDPANLYYRNAFDLVRIHLFGKFDKGFTPEKLIDGKIIEKTDSFARMIDFCRSLPEVLEHSENNVALMQRLEQQDEFVREFFEESDDFKTDIKDEQKEEVKDEPKEEKDKSWIVKLDGLKSPFAKLDIIFSNDEQIGNLFYYDTFRDNICFIRKPYWHRNWVEGTALQDKDMSHIRGHLDKVYDIKGKDIIEDAIVIEADKIQKNRVLEYFESLVWDGTERLEFFFHDFFKVPLNPFTRAGFKHWLVGAVSRIYKAGSPMDLLLIIKGKQGIGKSLFFKRLATIDFNQEEEHLYSDTKIDFDKAKDSYEQLEGVWIYEWKELAGMNMSEQESIKAFVDKTEDKFRRSYGRRNVEIKRRVAFCGSTNEKQPLRDRTGNRRFLIYESPLEQHECYIKDPDVTGNPSKFTQYYKDQLIAEAIHLYKNKFNIFQWSKEELEWWERSNQDNLAENDLLGTIQSYLQMRRPRNWYSMSQDEMRQYVKEYDFQNDKPIDELWKNALLERAEKVCIPELWKIALNQRDITINRYHRELLLQAIDTLGWDLIKRQARFGVFGHQMQIVKKKSQKEKEKEESFNADEDLPF